jgi:hypothetical protein
MRAGVGMKRSGATGQRLAAIFMMGCVALNYPILSLFSGRVDVAGIPLLYVYVFVLWTVLIGVMAVVVERLRD